MNNAKQLSRNPLGIIGLFLVLIYVIAGLFLKFSSETLSYEQRWPLVYFLVIFPIIVLAAFIWLVIKHPTKLYAPSDYNSEEGFFRSLSIDPPQNAQSTRLQDTEREVVTGKAFGAEEILIDGKKFFRCSFHNSTLIFEGREPVAFVESGFFDVSWRLENYAALTVDFLKTLHQSSDQGKTLVVNTFSWLKSSKSSDNADQQNLRRTTNKRATSKKASHPRRR